jgi:outer membrane protein TolC
MFVPRCKPAILAGAIALLAVAVRLPAQAPSPALSLADVAREARLHRAEITAARSRAEALGRRPAIAGALEDPMISPSVDHYPFEMMDEDTAGGRYDWSISIEQSFPLSRVRAHRRSASQAEARRATALADQAALDVVFEAQQSFLMLRERRLMRGVLEQQARLTRELVSAAAARYAGGTGTQADVLRAEVEAARVAAAGRALVAQTRSAEAMLNARLGRPVDAPVGDLDNTPLADQSRMPLADLLVAAVNARPELRAGQAEVERSGAEVAVMRSMYHPMATLRVGRASTMAEGPGAMFMFGVTVPIWRDKLRAGVDEARAMERMAIADLQAMRLMIEGETAAAVADVEAAREAQQALEADVVPRARQAIDATLSAYAAGQTTLSSVVEASGVLWDARSELIMVATAADLARLRLQRTIGESPGEEGSR